MLVLMALLPDKTVITSTIIAMTKMAEAVVSHTPMCAEILISLIVTLFLC